MLLLKAMGGLCNRIRTIDSLLALSRIMDTRLKVIWEKNDDLNSSFQKLFEYTGAFDLQETGYYSKNHPVRRFNGLINRFRLARLLRLTGYDGIFYGADVQKKKDENFDFTTLNPEKNHYFHYWGKVVLNPEPFKDFTPVREILDIIDRVTDEFTGDTVGVHIRRTDNSAAIRNSPVELFINRMKDVEQDNPKSTFFLATDDMETENHIKGLFPGRVFTYDKEIARNKESGIRDAVVDLYALSRTAKVLGSYWSSFSHTAAEIGGIPEETIKS